MTIVRNSSFLKLLLMLLAGCGVFHSRGLDLKPVVGSKGEQCFDLVIGVDEIQSRGASRETVVENILRSYCKRDYVLHDEGSFKGEQWFHYKGCCEKDLTRP